jgi:hypothetical protein
MWSAAIRTPLRARLGLACTVSLALLGAACRREAVAQPPADPLGPIGCFELADAKGLASETALDLCGGATSVAPGECYVGAVDRVHVLTTQKIIQLCRRATSLEPLACFERLHATGTLTEDQVLDYCAMRCPLGPAPAEASNPECVAGALERTNLANQTIGELCTRSRSAGPVECFVRGEEVSQLAESQLVQLCAERPSCQYVTAAPPAY